MKVLVVEDQFLVAEDMRRSVMALEGEVVGPFPNLSKARDAIREQRIDLALLDVQLQRDDVFPLVDELVQRKVPFIFATGYDEWVLPSTHRDHPRLEKPVSVEAIREALTALRSPPS